MSLLRAHSLAFHGRPRYTGDLDIVIRATPDNAARVIELLKDFGFGGSGVAEKDFTQTGQVIQLGRSPNGVGWDSRFYLSKEALIRNKHAAGHPQDLADLDSLGH